MRFHNNTVTIIREPLIKGYRSPKSINRKAQFLALMQTYLNSVFRLKMVQNHSQEWLNLKIYSRCVEWSHKTQPSGLKNVTIYGVLLLEWSFGWRMKKMNRFHAQNEEFNLGVKVVQAYFKLISCSCSPCGVLLMQGRFKDVPSKRQSLRRILNPF